MLARIEHDDDTRKQKINIEIWGGGRRQSKITCYSFGYFDFGLHPRYPHLWASLPASTLLLLLVLINHSTGPNSQALFTAVLKTWTWDYRTVFTFSLTTGIASKTATTSAMGTAYRTRPAPGKSSNKTAKTNPSLGPLPRSTRARPTPDPHLGLRLRPASRPATWSTCLASPPPSLSLALAELWGT